jgi:hypothetical protein
MTGFMLRRHNQRYGPQNPRLRDPIRAGVIIAVTAAASSCGRSAAKPHASIPPPLAKTSVWASSGTADGAPAEPLPGGYK